MGEATLRIWSCHRPPLQAGTYTLVVEQRIGTRDVATEKIFDADNCFREERTFLVGSNRFALAPTDVHAVFPPSGGDGDYGQVLPHVVLARSTLPWERSACAGDMKSPPPWLALLVLRASEFTGPTSVKLSELPDALQRDLTDTEKSSESPVTVIDVDREVLRRIAPSAAELALLTHVRGSSTLAEPNAECVAVIVSKRLPVAGEVNSVHLVALEGRYESTADGSFTLNLSAAPERVRLVCLKSWQFACSKNASLAEKLDALARTSTRLHAPLRRRDKDYKLPYARIQDRRAPAAATDRFAWYRGPLAGLNAAAPEPSYAVARELGRQLALQSPTVGASLLRWRTTHRQTAIAQEDQRAHRSPLQDPTPAESPPPPLPAEILSWLKSCTLLQGIPFRHLVPDEQMLPAESLRGFVLDATWIARLVAGAVILDDVEDLLMMLHAMEPVQTGKLLSGLLLRSAVVTAWPALTPEAFDDQHSALRLLSIARPSPDVLLCLFDGEFAAVRIRKPAALSHFELPATATDGRDPLYRFIELRELPDVTSSASLAQSFAK